MLDVKKGGDPGGIPSFFGEPDEYISEPASKSEPSVAGPIWERRKDAAETEWGLRSSDVVRVTGFEPARREPMEPKSIASANSAIPAKARKS